MKSGRIDKFFYIFGAVIPALFCLYFIYSFGVNVPYYDEWFYFPLLKTFILGKPWLHLLADSYNEHIQIFPRLLLLLTAPASSWNVVDEMYVNWILIGINVIICWFLLKETLPEDKWLIVPISWILFSLSQYQNLLTGWNQQIALTVSAVLLSVYFLNKANKSLVYLAPAVIFAYMASFSLLYGLVIWLLGFASFFKIKGYRKRLALFLWILLMVVALVLYYIGYQNILIENQNEIQNLFIFLSKPASYTEFVFAFLGANTGSEYLIWSAVSGCIVFLVFITGLYLINFDKSILPKMIPWIQIGVFTLLTALVTGIGRLQMGVEAAITAHYSTISILLFLATLVVSVEGFRILRTKIKSKIARTVLTSIFFILLVVGIIEFCIISVYGWSRGQDTFITRSSLLSCVLSRQNYCLDDQGYNYTTRHGYIDDVIKMKLGPFADSGHPELKVTILTKLDKSYWERVGYNRVIDANIDFVNGQSTKNNTVFYVDTKKNSFIVVSGWAVDGNNHELADSVSVVLNKEFLSTTYYGLPRNDVAKIFGKNAYFFSGWGAVFSTRGLTLGCYNATLIIIKYQEKNAFNTDYMLCLI